MAPLKLSLTVYQGATFRRVITWSAGTPAVPVSLVGCTARMQVREKLDAPAVLLELTTENGRIVLGGLAGTVTLVLTAAETEALTWRSGVYDLEIEFPSGDVRRLLAGTVRVVPEVTRD